MSVLYKNKVIERNPNAAYILNELGIRSEILGDDYDVDLAPFCRYRGSIIYNKNKFGDEKIVNHLINSLNDFEKNNEIIIIAKIGGDENKMIYSEWWDEIKRNPYFDREYDCALVKGCVNLIFKVDEFMYKRLAKINKKDHTIEAIEELIIINELAEALELDPIDEHGYIRSSKKNYDNPLN